MSNNESKRLSFIIKKLEDRIDMKINEIKLIQEDSKQKRKINVRGEYTTGLRLFARKQYAKMLARKESKLLEKKINSDDYNPVTGTSKEYDRQIREVQLEKDLNLNKIAEHEARLEEIQRIKAENQVAKAEEQLAKAQEQLANHPYAPVQPVVVEEASTIIPVVESALDAIDNPQEPVVVEPIIPVVESAPNVVQDKYVEPTNVQVPVTETDEVELPPVSVEPLTAEEVPVQEEVIPEMPPVAVEVLPEEQRASIQEEVIPEIPPVAVEVLPEKQQVETVELPTANVKAETSEVDKLLESFGTVGATLSNDMSKIMEAITVAVRNYSTEVQKKSVDALSAKQAENDKLTADNKEKDEKISTLTAENENKDNTIANLTVEGTNKDRQIEMLNAANVEKSAQIATQEATITERNSVIAQKESEIDEKNAMIAQRDAQIAAMRAQIETMSKQFEDIRVMMSTFQTQMQAVHQEEGPQYVKAN